MKKRIGVGMYFKNNDTHSLHRYLCFSLIIIIELSNEEQSTQSSNTAQDTEEELQHQLAKIESSEPFSCMQKGSTVKNQETGITILHYYKTLESWSGNAKGGPLFNITCTDNNHAKFLVVDHPKYIVVTHPEC